MPGEDKWGHQFFYATKEGGFFWQQNNNFRKDEDSGMLRLGKETDDCVLINEATGEWEFPYLADGDGISLSGGTGHHTGGEKHGCQGFAYMVDNTWDTNPTTFRFRKEMYHVNYDTDPKTGVWTHPAFNFKIQDLGRFVGLGWVRYNKKDGAKGTGHNTDDSVILEAWGNPDPDGGGKWVMLKRTEDKGGWGDGGKSCDGDEDQIGTWAAIQWRFKSSSSDFSLHPRHPEHNEGSNIDCIGGEDMSFQKTLDRGYCYASDVPRDIEMKCLIKKIGSGGKCRFKNISLREIDPLKSFEEEPGNPTPDDPAPQTPTEITGVMTFEWDINHQRKSSCAGAGNEVWYSFNVGDPEDESVQTLCNHADHNNRTALGQKIMNSSANGDGKTVVEFKPALKEHGSPLASPTIKAKIWNSSGGVEYTSPTEIDPTTLTGTFGKYPFDFSTNDHPLVVGDIVGVEYTGTDPDNAVTGGYDETGGTTQCFAKKEAGKWIVQCSKDLAADILE